MTKPLLREALWNVIEPLWPKHVPSVESGHPRLDDRRALIGILFVLKTGLQWEDFALGNGLRLRDDVLAETPRLAGRRNPGTHPRGTLKAARRCGEDRLVAGRRGQFQRAGSFWGALTGKNPTDRGKSGSKHHLLVDGQGVPLASHVSSANRNDSRLSLPLLISIAMLKAKERSGRRRDRLPKRRLGDRAYGSKVTSGLLSYLGVESNLARPRTNHGSGLGKERYVAEQTIAAIHQNRRLKLRYEKRPDIHQAVLTLACIKVCSYRLAK